jgi:hypothetical protein
MPAKITKNMIESLIVMCSGTLTSHSAALVPTPALPRWARAPRPPHQVLMA